MEIIEKYLDEVCGCITSVPYRHAARRELQNHMKDSMEYAERNGTDRREAAMRAITEMGNAQETGHRLNEHFSVRPDMRLIIYVLGIFCLYTAAGLKINYSFPETILTLLAYTVCVGLFSLLKKIDMEGNIHLIKYLYFGTMLLSLAVNIFADAAISRKFMSTGGTILFFCVTFYIYRLHQNNLPGLMIALCLFLLPVPLFMFPSAYASLLLYITAGIYTFVYFIIRGWMLNRRNKTAFYTFIAVMPGIMVVLCRTVLFMKWNLWDHFFLRDGLDHFPYLAENFRTYPLAACISCYGSWTALIYIILFSLVLAELLRMKRKVHYLWGRNILNCIFLILLMKGAFAILLNLGVPLIRSYILPFAGFGSDQVSNFLLIVMAEYVYCFGDAVFADCSFFEEHKSFETGNNRITFYFNPKKNEKE